uniref:Uncharacterized protein n=1 Tax=Tetranychus urticae TaxID=32264 RepID=T1L4F2_TETUR
MERLIMGSHLQVIRLIDILGLLTWRNGCRNKICRRNTKTRQGQCWTIFGEEPKNKKWLVFELCSTVGEVMKMGMLAKWLKIIMENKSTIITITITIYPDNTNLLTDITQRSLRSP